MNYRRITTGGAEGIQGGIWPALAEAGSFVQLFIAVENVAASVQSATALGARVLIPPTPLPEGGELAVLHDPVGMSFGVYRRT
jgi:predicted enzyme related to lactoylglutathione lyase